MSEIVCIDKLKEAMLELRGAVDHINNANSVLDEVYADEKFQHIHGYYYGGMNAASLLVWHMLTEIEDDVETALEIDEESND